MHLDSTRHRLAGTVGLLSALFVTSALTAPAAAQTTFVETFDTGNAGAWTFGTGNEVILDADGNPGRYLSDSSLVTFTPRASTSFGVASAYTGDYRARGVTSVGIDLAIVSVTGNVGGRRMTLILLNDNETPSDLEDDWGAYTVTNFPIPPVGPIGLSPTAILQWTTYDVPVPSQSGALPSGWQWISKNMLRGGGSWSRLMRNVSHVGFIMGDPALLYPLLNWDVAMDNPRITTTP